MISRRQMLTFPAALALPVRGILAQPTPPSTTWPSGTPEDLGFAADLGTRIESRLPEFPAVTGVLVIRHGVLAFETYRGGYDAATLVNIRSVTKSLTSTLVGIALHRGDIDRVDLTVGDVIPDRIPASADPEVANITMESFLSMTSGLWWDNHTDWQMLLAAPNWVENTLQQPIIAPQGTQFIYNTGGSHLVGVMLATLVGQPLEDYATTHLFAPLGIESGSWMRSPQGEVNGGAGLELLPRDTAKLGQVLLEGGAWQGEQLVDPAYAIAATTRQSDGEAVTGGAIGVPYGFQWWITNQTGHQAFFALGFGGQYVYVVPALDLVVVVAAGFPDGTTPVLTSHRPIPEQIVIPAIIS